MTTDDSTDLPETRHDQPKKPLIASLSDIQSLEKDHYFQLDNPLRALVKERNSNDQLNRDIEFMIMNSIDAGHYEGALSTIQEMLMAGRCCPKMTIMHLIDLILCPGHAYERLSASSIVLMANRVTHTLLMILESFGFTAFSDLWNVFYDCNSSRRRLRKRTFTAAALDDDPDDEAYESSLSEFLNFQDLFSSCVQFNGDKKNSRRRHSVPRGPSMKAPAAHYRRRMVLDVLLAVLEDELRQTEGDPSAIESCTLLLAIEGGRQFQLWIEIIFSTFGSDMDHVDEMIDTSIPDLRAIHAEFGSRFLNMLIAASYCSDAINEKDLLFQSFRRLSTLNVDGCANLMQMIKFRTFTFTVLDMIISDTNISKVPQQRKILRKQKPSVDFMEKFIHFDLKTRPTRLDHLDDVYRHVQITVWKFMLGTNLRCMLNPLSETEVNIMGLSRHSIKEWKNDIDDMVRYVHLLNKSESDLDNLQEDKISWAVSIAENI